MKKILIFDASNYMFRAHYAAPPMNNSVGFPTGALHFYTTMILSVMHRVQPDAVALAHDFKGPKFRHELYPDYKGQREAPPEALQMQFPWFRKITDALGIPAYEAEHYEADDIIATITRKARDLGWYVVIASSDKDLMQLVERDGDQDSVVLLDALAKSSAKTGQMITVDQVLARFQVTPDKVADVLALAGDTVDNIPGCKGIGEKTAGKLIAEYGSIENLMANLDKIKKPAQHANLVDFAPKAELSKKLTTLVSDIPLELRMETMNPNPAEVVQIFSSLELHRLLSEVLGGSASPDPTVERVQIPESFRKNETPRAECIENSEKASDSKKKQVIHEMPESALATPLRVPKPVRDMVETVVCQEVETLRAFLEGASGRIALYPIWMDENLSHRRMIGCALAHEKSAIYVAIRHTRTLFGETISSQELEDCLLAFMGDSRPKAVFGLKPILQYAFLKGKSVETSAYWDDEMAAYLVHPERSTLNLATCCSEYLGISLEPTPENWLGTGKKAVLPSSFGPSEVAKISGPWVQGVLQLSEILPDELAHHRLIEVYESMDRPLAEVLADMEFRGVRIDTESLMALSRTFDAEIRALDEKAHSFSDEPFNINSPKDLARFLFEVLELKPTTKKKRTHGLSTDQETLESMDHPIAQIILEYRALSKMKSTYSESLVQLVDRETQRIHGRFNACVTATTRLSSSEPNLQNIPARTELGRQIKRTFVAELGCSFISADYSQIELRLMAALSQEPVLCRAYHEGEDVHARTAATLLDIPIESVTKAQRQLAKTINFGLLYGMGVQKLARETGYSKTDAKAFLEKFHAQFPTLSHYFERQVEEARQRGETRTIAGHRRPIPELFSQNAMIRAFGERVAQNAPVQGSASDVVKRAMIAFYRTLKNRGLHGHLLIQVHDELLVECPDEELEITSEILRTTMEHAENIGVPLCVDLKTGKNWADMG